MFSSYSYQIYFIHKHETYAKQEINFWPLMAVGFLTGQPWLAALSAHGAGECF